MACLFAPTNALLSIPSDTVGSLNHIVHNVLLWHALISLRITLQEEFGHLLNVPSNSMMTIISVSLVMLTNLFLLCVILHS